MFRNWEVTQRAMIVPAERTHFFSAEAIRQIRGTTAGRAPSLTAYAARCARGAHRLLRNSRWCARLVNLCRTQATAAAVFGFGIAAPIAARQAGGDARR